MGWGVGGKRVQEGTITFKNRCCLDGGKGGKRERGAHNQAGPSLGPRLALRRRRLAWEGPGEEAVASALIGQGADLPKAPPHANGELGSPLPPPPPHPPVLDLTHVEASGLDKA
ncbi:hypothetical protein KIL84_002154 [Mauremys mutica]|uniref:Uncharacterized protein n=1 Tax=Mauremys mutica TaxID=74926 RepID=A0A9D3XLD4_9SAUR|nr:hypothetical protein KIL84_002154 [Mauremys mutica]